MTIANTVRKAGPFTCNAVTTVFPFTFKVFGNSDVVVSLTDSFGVITTLPLTSAYTVALNTNQDVSPGGTVTTLIAYAAGYLITLTSSVAATQQVTLTNTGGFYPDVINAALDRTTILIQQLYEIESRQITFPISDNPSQALPPAAQRIGKYLTFDAFGNPVASAGSGADGALRTDLAASSGAALIGASSGSSVQASFDSIISFGTSYSVTGAAALSLLQINKQVVCSGTTIDYTVSLPATSNIGDGVMLAIARQCTRNITITAAAGSGLYIEGFSQINLFAGEKVLLVYDGTEWKIEIDHRIPIAAEFINSGLLTLPIATQTYLPLVVGNQLMDAPISVFYDLSAGAGTGRFIAPRDGVYRFSLNAWFTGTGALTTCDVGFYINSGVVSANGSPPSTSFVRRNLSSSAYQTLSFERQARLGKGSWCVPTFFVTAGTTARIEDNAIVTTAMTVTESIVR